MQDEPTSAEILRAVSLFMRGSEPGRIRKYDLLVASNALDLIGRQLEGQGAANLAEMTRLEALLDRSGSLEELNRALCEAIRSAPYGELKRYAEHLLQTTLEKLAIDQPTYSTFVEYSARMDTELS